MTAPAIAALRNARDQCLLDLRAPKRADDACNSRGPTMRSAESPNRVWRLPLKSKPLQGAWLARTIIAAGAELPGEAAANA